jgi:sirohydrochlorin ferrochelatase
MQYEQKSGKIPSICVVLVDRGSKAVEVRHELERLCEYVKELGGYTSVEYCFLEVAKPSLKEKLEECAKKYKYIYVFPYFLHKGLKYSMTVNFVKSLNQKGIYVVEDVLGVHEKLIEVVLDRALSAISDKPQNYSVLLIGHGSSYEAEKNDLNRIANLLKEKGNFKDVYACFLELCEPTIQQALSQLKNERRILIIPYFLHYGIHMQFDLPRELPNLPNVEIRFAKHLGVDKRIAEIIVEKVEALRRVTYFG